MSKEGKSPSQESKRLESVAHELFHGLQYENNEFERGKPTVNSEIGAYLFGRAVALDASLPIDGFGTSTESGKKYQNAMQGLLFGNAFNPSLYRTVLEEFKLGSVANNGSSLGLYNNFRVLMTDTNPAIKRFYPLVR